MTGNPERGDVVEAEILAVRELNSVFAGEASVVPRVLSLLSSSRTARISASTTSPRSGLPVMCTILGKISVPENILVKTGPLSSAELLMMRKHVGTGYDILRDWDVLRVSPRWMSQTVLDVVLGHHERWDGGGYPKASKAPRSRCRRGLCQLPTPSRP